LEEQIKTAKPEQHHLVVKARQALSFSPALFRDESDYTKDPDLLMKKRQEIARLIMMSGK